MVNTSPSCLVYGGFSSFHDQKVFARLLVSDEYVGMSSRVPKMLDVVGENLQRLLLTCFHDPGTPVNTWKVP